MSELRRQRGTPARQRQRRQGGLPRSRHLGASLFSSPVRVSLKGPSCPRGQGQALPETAIPRAAPGALCQWGPGDRARSLLLAPAPAWLDAATPLCCVETCPSTSWKVEEQQQPQAEAARSGDPFSEVWLVGQYPSRCPHLLVPCPQPDDLP